MSPPTQTRYSVTRPANKVLRWLTDPGADTPPHIAQLLLGELFASPKAVIAGVVNGLLLDTVALCMHAGNIFALFIAFELALVMARFAIVRRAQLASAQGLPTPTAQYLITASFWCALEGSVALVAMRTGLVALQLLTAGSVVALVGPICARNYAAPRYAMLLVMLCFCPYMIGAALTGNPWLLIPIVQMPLFLLGVITTIKRFQTMAISTLLVQQESHHHARHDALTGLLNRFGLMETLDSQFEAKPRRFTLFYLDLDGFKPINDSFGHQAGDKVLHEVAERLRASVRASDIISRLGGDEFVIIAPDLAPIEAGRFADRVIQCVGDAPFDLPDIGAVRVGVSVGFACTPEDGVPGDDLHRKADTALYAAKAAGKGIYRRFTPALDGAAEGRAAPDRSRPAAARR